MDMEYDDPLYTPTRHIVRMAADILVTSGGCMLINANKRVDVPGFGKRLYFLEYVYARCISAALPKNVRVCCCAAPRGKKCVAPCHIINEDDEDTEYVVEFDDVCEEVYEEPSSGMFDDLPPVSLNPEQTFVFGVESLPVDPALIAEYGTATETFVLPPSPHTYLTKCATNSYRGTTPSFRAGVP